MYDDLEDFANDELKRVAKDFQIEFENLKQMHIKRFIDHPVTKALLGGGDAGLLGGYGDLRGFLGLTSEQANSDILTIIKIYEESRLIIVKRRKTIFDAYAETPSREEIFAISPLPWASGRSWAEGIERGIAGFGYFLSGNYKNSRSELGIQTKIKMRGGKMARTRYISFLVNDFYKDAQKIIDKI